MIVYLLGDSLIMDYSYQTTKLFTAKTKSFCGCGACYRFPMKVDSAVKPVESNLLNYIHGL